MRLINDYCRPSEELPVKSGSLSESLHLTNTSSFVDDQHSTIRYTAYVKQFRHLCQRCYTQPYTYGLGSFENFFTSAVMSMMQRILIADHNSPPEPMSVSNYNVFQGIVVNRYPVTDAAGKTHKFVNNTEASAATLVVKHMTTIG